MEAGRQMLHASEILFSPGVWGEGSHVSLKIIFKQVSLAEMWVQTCMGCSFFSLPDAFLLLTLHSHTVLSHFSTTVSDLGKTIRKVTKSFLILWRGSHFRTKVFLHLFFLQILKQPKNPPWISSLSLFFPHFFVSFFCLCSQRKSSFWNPKCQVLSPLLHISGLTGLQLPRWLRSEIHPYKNPVSDNSWYLKERKGGGKKKAEGKKISRIRSVLLTCFMIPCHEAWAYILLQTVFNFLCYMCSNHIFF